VTALNSDSWSDKFRSASYLPSGEILTLSKLAVKLGKPILIEGPPGTGKTSYAVAMAKILATKLYRIQCYEGITAEQVIGEFNYQRQLLAIEVSRGGEISDIFTDDYFIARPLLQVLKAESPVVLLIDEVDRSDEEFEAFLLEALGENQVTIPELGTIHAKSKPIVILTSNGTRELSGALRRRSLFLALDYPSASRESEIIKIHVPELESQLGEKIVALLRSIRRNDKIAQPPSISEGIELAKTLLLLGKDYLELPAIEEILGLLAKSSSDLQELRKQLLTQA
jgi:MoxR-like ATPase